MAGLPQKRSETSWEGRLGPGTGLEALEGELYPLAWRSLILKCHWEQIASQGGQLCTLPRKGP